MGKTVKVLLSGGVVAACAAAALGGAIDEQQKAQNKLLAYRAARADAIRKLAERIRGLSITSETYVRDFVTESDRIETAMDAFLAGVRESGKPRHMEDGTCEVTMEVTIETVITTLKQIHARYYQGNRFRVQDFDQMTTTNKVAVLRETGMGAPREELAEDVLIPNPAGGVVSITLLPPAAKAFWIKHCTARGRLMAERAARVEAMRRLGERVRGVYITSQTTVQDFVAQSDQVNVSMSTFLKGAREIGVRYHDDELVVEVEMQVKLRTVYATLKTWGQAHYRGDRAQVARLEELIVKAEDTLIKETGHGVPPTEYLKPEAPAEVRQTVILAGATPPWAAQTLRAAGSAALDADNPNAAQARLMAFRAAELDARRKLAEEVNGLRITSNTSVADFVAQNDRIGAAMTAFQQGIVVLEDSRKLADDGTARVTAELELRPLWNMILFYQRKLSIQIK